MVRISLHKQQQQKELKDANVKVKLNKHNFSPEFASKLYEFSEIHHADHFKTFNAALKKWLIEHHSEIEAEISKDHTVDSESIYHKIKISARFYYRKKSKKEAKEIRAKEETKDTNNTHEKNEKKKKPYIGLSQPFIIVMDEYIKKELLHNAENIKRKTEFANFTQMHIQNIKDELAMLKQKYDESQIMYDPIEISKKIKKAFENRFYTFATIK